jgi:hypothetical protein
VSTRAWKKTATKTVLIYLGFYIECQLLLLLSTPMTIRMVSFVRALLHAFEMTDRRRRRDSSRLADFVSTAHRCHALRLTKLAAAALERSGRAEFTFAAGDGAASDIGVRVLRSRLSGQEMQAMQTRRLHRVLEAARRRKLRALPSVLMLFRVPNGGSDTERTPRHARRIFMLSCM